MKAFKVILLVMIMASFSSCKYRRCKIKSCQTRMIHGHGSKEFRGMPWWKKQNPKTGEGYEEPNRENKR